MANPDNRSAQIGPDTSGERRPQAVPPLKDRDQARNHKAPVEDRDSQDIDPDSAESDNNRNDTVDDDVEA
ncbi:MAG: hypothetical protein ABL986_12920 [Vicinamibacterales bacterium]